jgi:glucosamine kinase
MQFFIGLDAGGSGSRACMARSDGYRGTIIHGGPANLHSDPVGARTQIAALLSQLVQAEALDNAPNTAIRVVLGVAGAAETGHAADLAAHLPYPNVRVMGDIDIAVSGALQDRDGIVMAVGTGSVVARQQAGQITRIGGHGFMLGDEASGAWLGRRAMSLALQVRDGLLPDAPLARAVWARFKTLPAMLTFTTSARPADYAALAPQVMALDKAGCPLARQIVTEGCTYLLRAIRLLQAGKTSLPVAALGGLGPALLERVAAQADPALTLIKPLGTGLDGALWQARQMAQEDG